MRTSIVRASGVSGSGFGFDLLGAREQLFDRRVIERAEHQHARAREQGGVEFERRVFRRRADQHDRAVFHHREERVLLCAIEAMHLIDEQQRALAHFASRARGIEHLLEVGDAGEHGRDLLELELGRIRQKPRHRRLAGAGRAPEDHRAERARLAHARDHAVRSEQMILADDFAERLRPQLVGKRARRFLFKAGGGEEIGAGSAI